MSLLIPCGNAPSDHCARHVEGCRLWRKCRYIGRTYRFERYECWDFLPGVYTKAGAVHHPRPGKRCTGSRRWVCT